MRTGSFLKLALALAFLVLAGCAPTHPVVVAPPPRVVPPPTHRVVLVPDPDGHVGKAEVIHHAGSQVLEKKYDMTTVSGPSSPPTSVATAPPDYIASTFADALTTEPSPSEKFILFFETGKTSLNQESRNTMQTIFEAIEKRKPVTISVVGHADAAGSVAQNDKLSLERAGMVKELLLKKGVNPAMVTVSSHGKRNPLVATPDGVAEARNRRVEVVIR